MVFRSCFTYAYSSAVISGLFCRCRSAPSLLRGNALPTATVSVVETLTFATPLRKVPAGTREWTSSMLLLAFGLLDCFLARAAPGFFGILLSFPPKCGAGVPAFQAWEGSAASPHIVDNGCL